VQSFPVGFGGRDPLAVACTATAYLNNEQVEGAEITAGTEDAAVERMKAVLDKLSERLWERRHANGWTARVITEADGSYRHTAQEDAPGAMRWSGHVGTLDDAQVMADSQVPQHNCSPATCGAWQEVGRIVS
jgi:hypothetical protein